MRSAPAPPAPAGPSPRTARALELLRRATDIPGLPGHEAELVAWFEAEARALGAETRLDRMGSCVALLPAKSPGGPRPRLLVAAHADAIGLVVTEVTRDGFLRVAPLGGVDSRLLPAQEVWVHGTRRLPGVFGTVPPHFQSPGESRKPIPFDELFVDVGLPAARARRSVRVGDLVSFRTSLQELLGGRVTGRALDNRASVTALLLAIEQLAGWNHAWDVYGAATVQEEVGRGCLGALTTTFAVRPDVALAMDVTHGEAPGADDWQTFKMDGGPVLCAGPNVHPAVFRALADTADAEQIPYQVEPSPRSTGTDAMDIQVVGHGVPTGVVGIPLRSMHSAVESLCLRDLERAAELVARFAVRLERGLPGRDE
ncbi:MAG TPA: M20/M25/M40 family metallo-hydrolase [Candidatus Saccharimonadales bacterium]|nr:M20/M25/M40 family metallo-hydrolase [Candidatus Saccharimonadales bacterium]